MKFECTFECSCNFKNYESTSIIKMIFRDHCFNIWNIPKPGLFKNLEYHIVTLCCFPKMCIFQSVTYEQLCVSHTYIKTRKCSYTLHCACFLFEQIFWALIRNAILNAFLKWNADTSSDETHLFVHSVFNCGQETSFPRGAERETLWVPTWLGSQTIGDIQSTWEDEKSDSILSKFHFPLKISVLTEGLFS